MPRDLDVVALDLALTDLATFDPEKARPSGARVVR
jgi:hypothetical protein